MYNRNADKQECIRILDQIEDRIPKRRYAKKVQRLMEYQGKEVPGIYKIQAVKNRRQFDLDIVKALEAISNEKEEAELEEGFTMPIDFEEKTVRSAPKKAISHRSRGKVKQKVG